MVSETLQESILAQANASQVRNIITQASVLAGGQRFDAQRFNDVGQAQELQRALAVARHQYGHALCSCRRHPLKLQVRLRDGKYHLAVWPDEGSLHDSNCAFFREEKSYREEFGPLVQPVGDAHDQAHSIAFAFEFGPPEDGGGRNAPRQKTPQAERRDAVVTLHGLSNILWEEASLNRWHPKWSRDWGRTRYELMRAGQRLLIKGDPLSHRMFIPNPYREGHKELLNAEVSRFIDGMVKGQGTPAQSGVLIAPVRKITAGHNNAMTLHFRHMLSTVSLSQETVGFLRDNCKRAMRRIDQLTVNAQARISGASEASPEPIAFLMVRVNARGVLSCRAAWIMLAHPRVFIPTNTSEEVRLVDALIAEEHQFSRNLSTESPMRRNNADWILRHVVDPAGVPIPRAALEIRSIDTQPPFIAKRKEIACKLAERGVPVWEWSPTSHNAVVPPLPPRDGMDAAAIEPRLGQIKMASDVGYGYGANLSPAPVVRIA